MDESLFDEIRDRVTRKWPLMSPERADEIADFVILELKKAKNKKRKVTGVVEFENFEEAFVEAFMGDAVKVGKLTYTLKR